MSFIFPAVISPDNYILPYGTENVNEWEGRLTPSLRHPEDFALGVPQSLPRARGKEALALPVAEKARAPFPQRSKTARISVSPQQFSGTARWTGGPLAVDEVPAQRMMDSFALGQAGQGTVPCPISGTVPCPISVLDSFFVPYCKNSAICLNNDKG